MLYENSCVGYLVSMLSMVDCVMWREAKVSPYGTAIWWGLSSQIVYGSWQKISPFCHASHIDIDI